jgi:hypothetical protein
VAATTAATVLAFTATGIRPGTMRRPMVGGDLLAVYAEVRGLISHGWYLTNPDLGWPYGQDLRGYPTLDVTHLAIIRSSPWAARTRYSS